MARSEPTILTGWWDFAVRAFALLTTPRADVAQSDRQLEALARDSVAGGALHAASDVIRRAWSASRTRSTIASVTAAAVPPSADGQWRLGGWMIVVTGLTALAAVPFSSVSTGLLIWITPALLVVAGLCVMACAAPLARAAADRRRRPSSSSTQ